jgi:tetraacyldisaccharide 4'-kinase
MKDALRGEPKKLTWPVVSVGSLSAGGAGKTPVVIALASLLKDEGWDVDVLSRGYGRVGSGVERVACASEQQIFSEDDRKRGEDNSRSLRDDHQKSKGNDQRLGERVDAARFGDEPVLIAERAGVDVWVGADRYAAGQKAEAGSSAALRKDNQKSKSVHVLDDGFQHRQLARAVDVVLVTAEDLEDALVPAGNLREPLTALRRADVVVVREDEVEDVAKRVWPLMREGTQMWVVRRRLRFPGLHSSASCLGLHVFGAGLKPIAFCALARPEGFAAMLLEAGCGIVEGVAYRDHHRYNMENIERLIEVAKGLHATGFVTTEKDAVKLSGAMRKRLEQVGPVMVVALDAEFADSEAVVRALEGLLTAGAETAA